MRMISREDLKQRVMGHFCGSCSTPYKDTDILELGEYCCDMVSDTMAFIDELPTNEAEPDNGWISVEDRLPEAIYDCLVWYSCDTPFGKSKSVGIAYCSRGDWYTKHLNGDNIVVLYWLPLPELPKEDKNG